jgi:hypothetical protein
MCAAVKVKKIEMNKERRKSSHSTRCLPKRKDVSTSDNLQRATEKSKPPLLESFSFIEMFSSTRDTSKSDPRNSVAELSKDFTQPQFSSQSFIKANQFSKKKSVKNVVRKLSKLQSITVKTEPQFFSPLLHVHLSSRPALSLSIDDQVSTVKECPEVLSNQQDKAAAEHQVVTESHQSPLLLKEQDIDNLTKHQHALWSWSKNIHKQCWEEITTMCSGLDSLSDHKSYTEQARVMSSDKVLKQTPIDEGSNVVNSDSDEKALCQFMELLNIPKRTVATQVDLVETVLQGSENVAVENETDSRYVQLIGVMQRIMSRLPKSDILHKTKD